MNNEKFYGKYHNLVIKIIIFLLGMIVGMLNANADSLQCPEPHKVVVEIDGEEIETTGVYLDECKGSDEIGEVLKELEE